MFMNEVKKSKQEGIPLSEWSGSGATNDLQKYLETFNKKSSKQTTMLVWLTWVLVGLTVILVVLTLILLGKT